MPAVFRAVRAVSNIDEADYMLSLAGNYYYILLTVYNNRECVYLLVRFCTKVSTTMYTFVRTFISKHTLLFILYNILKFYCYITIMCSGDFNYIEFIANSKSGQFFFYSHDGCYMIKTQSKEECVLLRQIMPQYVEHLTKHPNSLLVRFYGMHR